MKLFKYEGYKLTVEPEALLIKPFKLIWNRDRSASKDKAMLELGFIYFFADPRSDYQIITDSNLRKERIKEREGLSTKWEPDKIVLEGIAIYVEDSVTTSSLLMEDIRTAVNAVREELKNIDFTKTDNKDKPIYTIESVLKAANIAIDLIAKLNRVEQDIFKETVENNKMKGQGEKTIFEDGVNI